MAGARLTDGDEHGGSDNASPNGRPPTLTGAQPSVLGSIRTVTSPSNWSLTQIPRASTATRMRPVPGGHDSGDGVRVGIDPKTVLFSVRHPRRAMAEGNPRRAVPRRGGADLLPGLRIDAEPPCRARRLAHSVPTPKASSVAAHGRVLSRTALGRDPRDRSVAGVRDPGSPRRVDDPERPALDGDRVDDRVEPGSIRETVPLR